MMRRVGKAKRAHVSLRAAASWSDSADVGWATAKPPLPTLRATRFVRFLGQSGHT